MDLRDLDTALEAIGEQIQVRMSANCIEPVSFLVERSRLRVGVGSGVEQFSFIVQCSGGSWQRFEVWDYDTEEKVRWGTLVLQDLMQQQVAGLLCAAVKGYLIE